MACLRSNAMVGLIYNHFQLTPRLVTCEWAGGAVADVLLHNGETRAYTICSRCRKEVIFLGPEANVSESNGPAHLGGDDRIEYYRRRNMGAVLNYYHPLRGSFAREFGPLAAEEYMRSKAGIR